MILSTLGKGIWDVVTTPRLRRVIEVKQDMKNGEIGLDTWLIMVWTDKIRESIATKAWGEKGKAIF